MKEPPVCPLWSVSNVSLVTGWHTRMWLQADLSASERLRGGWWLATEDAALAAPYCQCATIRPPSGSLHCTATENINFRVSMSEWSDRVSCPSPPRPD